MSKLSKMSKLSTEFQLETLLELKLDNLALIKDQKPEDYEAHDAAYKDYVQCQQLKPESVCYHDVEANIQQSFKELKSLLENYNEVQK